MAWELDNTRPIYLQLIERIQLDIVTGIYKPGDQIPPVRELASLASVNPNTMQRALTELERLELVYTKRTSGRFITEDQTLLDCMKNELAAKHSELFLENMALLGFSHSDTIQFLNHYHKEEA